MSTTEIQFYPEISPVGNILFDLQKSEIACLKNETICDNKEASRTI